MQPSNPLTDHTIDYDAVWDSVLEILKPEVSPANFKVWFRDTYIHDADQRSITIGIPSVMIRDYIKNKFHHAILRAVRTILLDIRSLEYIVVQRTSRRQLERKRPPIMQSNPLPLTEYYVDTTDNLNPKYQLDNFVVGPFNQIAFAAAKTVIERPGIAYNPLFIHGHTGHGKTHLIQAIGNKLKRMGRKVFYVTSERFVVDYLNSVSSASANTFKDKYRRYDVLIMDDIQFFASKDKSQEELFHVFNAMHDMNKQLVFSCDVHPSLLDGLEERLKSRFSQGMTVQIPRPDFESRISIVSAKAAHLGIHLERPIIEYIAQVASGNIREIEGTLNSVLAQREINGHDLTLDEVKHVVGETVKQTVTPASDVIARVARFYNLTHKDMFEKSRKQEIVRARQMAMYILREDFKVSYPNIGDLFGGRDHTTVMHSCEKIKKECGQNQKLEGEIEKLRSLFR